MLRTRGCEEKRLQASNEDLDVALAREEREKERRIKEEEKNEKGTKTISLMKKQRVEKSK